MLLDGSAAALLASLAAESPTVIDASVELVPAVCAIPDAASLLAAAFSEVREIRGTLRVESGGSDCLGPTPGILGKLAVVRADDIPRPSVCLVGGVCIDPAVHTCTGAAAVAVAGGCDAATTALCCSTGQHANKAVQLENVPLSALGSLAVSWFLPRPRTAAWPRGTLRGRDIAG